MAELLASADDYGWFTPADLKRVLEAIHQVPQWGDVILVGGQSLSAWIKFFDIPIPPFDGPYLTADADFLGTRIEAQIIADYLKGRSRPATMDDQTINAALIEFTGEEGKKLIIDMLSGVLGMSDSDARKLAVPIQLDDWKPVRVLHPLLVLESRCANLQLLANKRNSNGITQAKVACLVAKKYLDSCVADPARRRESLDAAKRIARLAKSSAGVYVWTHWKIDVLTAVDPAQMPDQFLQSWAFETDKVERKRQIAERRQNAKRATAAPTAPEATVTPNQEPEEPPGESTGPRPKKSNVD